MIGFWTDAQGSFTVHEDVQLRGRPIAKRFAARNYEELAAHNLLAGRACNGDHRAERLRSSGA